MANMPPVGIIKVSTGGSFLPFSPRRPGAFSCPHSPRPPAPLYPVLLWPSTTAVRRYRKNERPVDVGENRYVPGRF